MDLRFLYRSLKSNYHDHKIEVSALTQTLNPGCTVIDVGANKGCFLRAFSRAVPIGQVIAFEPQQVLADYLRTNCLRGWGGRMPNVKVENMGVSDQVGSMELLIPGKKESSPSASFETHNKENGPCKTTQVPVTTLDHYFAETNCQIGAIKIDVEGHELSVLKGAKNLLSTQSPTIVCEIESRHRPDGSVLPVLDYLRELSYDGFFIHRSELKPIAEFNPDQHQIAVGERFWDHPDYCNNFILSKTHLSTAL